MDRLFTEFTGLHFHIWWAPSTLRQSGAAVLPSGCSACCRVIGSPLLRHCQTCGQKRFVRALKAGEAGHRFTCRLGVRNHWYPLLVRGEMLGIAYLQAADHSITDCFQNPTSRDDDSHRGKLTEMAMPVRALPGEVAGGGSTTSIHAARVRDSGKASPRRFRAVEGVLNQAEFDRAARFLRLVVQHVEISTVADLRLADLTSARCAVIALKNEQSWPRQSFGQHRGRAPQTPRNSGPESPPEQVVHRLLNRLDRDYAQPITLQRCAREIGMNAAYVSALFSRTVGIPFKAYLTKVRLNEAMILLSDPAKTASDVAYAVGYASENRFRSAFKKATGLSPRLWRETMQTSPPLASRSPSA